MLQVRNVPDEVHATLRARAAAARMSLSDYVLRELEHIAERRPTAQILLRSAPRTSEVSTDAIVAALHEGRAERESGW